MLALEAMSYARFFAIEHTFHIALNASHDQQHATVCGERETVRRCAHDGWGRQSNEVNRLEAAVCATCAVRDSASREFPRTERARIHLQDRMTI